MCTFNQKMFEMIQNDLLQADLLLMCVVRNITRVMATQQKWEADCAIMTNLCTDFITCGLEISPDHDFVILMAVHKSQY